MPVEIDGRTRACWIGIRRYLYELFYDQAKVALSLKTRMVKVEAIETLLDVDVDVLRGPFARNTTPNSAPFTTGFCFVYQSTAQEISHRMTSSNRALEITRCESIIETTLRTRRLLWARALIRLSDGWLPKRIMFENLEGATRRGRGGKEKEWTDWVQSDVHAFGI